MYETIHEDAGWYNERGKAHAGKGEINKAIADHTEAMRLDPTDTRAYNNRGNAYKKKQLHPSPDGL